MSNPEDVFGAFMILTQPAREEILKLFPEGRVTILPSSVHELIIFATRENENVAVYQEMVRSVNESVLAREEYLSNNVYHFDSNTGRLEIAE